MAPVVVPVPRTDAADRARPPIGPDDAADAIAIAIVARIAVERRGNVDASMEVAPLMEVGPVVRVAIPDIAAAIEARSYTIAPAAEHGTCAVAATMDREPAAPESAAVKGTATAVKSTTAETTTVKSAAAESTAATAAKAAAVPSAAAVTNLGRQAIACMFRHWSRTGARKRERFGALRRCGCECENRRSRNAQTADEAAPGIGYRHG